MSGSAGRRYLAPLGWSAARTRCRGVWTSHAIVDGGVARCGSSSRIIDVHASPPEGHKACPRCVFLCRPPWKTYGWCGACRAATCTTEHASPMKGCRDCEIDFPADAFPAKSLRCVQCNALRSAELEKRRYQNNEAHRQKVIARASARRKRVNTTAQARARMKRKRERERASRTVLGWAEPIRHLTHARSHVVVRDHRGNTRVACLPPTSSGVVLEGPKPERRYPICGRCVCSAWQLLGLPKPDMSWRQDFVRRAA